MLFRVLGEISAVTDDGEKLVIRTGKQRALLARLVLDANRVVARSLLMDALWGEALPLHPEAALQVVMSRLRASLGACGNSIVAEAGGYRLDAGTDEVDLLRAESLLRDGRLALANGEGSRASGIFERALSLWTGEALQDVADFAFAPEASQHIRALRVELIEARNDAYLIAGRHLEVLGDVNEWVALEPLREHLRAQQVVSLFRAGRQGEALRACAALRAVLRDELGLNPSPEMQRLERRVLEQDPTLLATDAGFMTPLPAWTAQAVAFVGRDEQYQQLLDRLAEAVEGQMRLVLVEGEAGIGKSRFLLEAAQRLARDAIVLPVHVHDVFRPALSAFARVLGEATLALSDNEMIAAIGAVGDYAREIDDVRALAAALAAGESIADRVDDDDVMRFLAPWIAALSAKAPVIVLVDELDNAGAAVLHVIGQLASLSMPRRVLVVGSARTSTRRTVSQLDRLTTAFDRMGWFERLTLEPLTIGEVDELLERMHVAPRQGLAERLHASTGGNPLLFSELLNSGKPHDIAEQWPSPPRIRDIARRRAAELGRATAELLQFASLFEEDFTVELLAEAAGTSASATAKLVDRAVDAHILHPSTLRSYRFTHQLFRQALLGDLTEGQRADGHRRIACTLERLQPVPGPALLAAHWAGATGPDVPAKLRAYARAAGHAAMQMFEPATAAKWFEIALDNVDDEAERGALLVELAQAQQFAGDPEGTGTLQAAVRLALDSGDGELTRRIVRATTPGWSTLPGVDGPSTQRLLEQALAGADDEVTRSRALARLAVTLHVSDPAAAELLASDAVARARRSRDRNALLEALLRRASFSLTPHSLGERRAIAGEVLELSSRSTDVVTRYFALATNIVTAIQAGEYEDTMRCTAEADAIVSQYDLAPLRWSAMTRHAWIVGLEGRLERAEELIERNREFGSRHGIGEAATVGLMQRALVRWQQGRAGRLVDVARRASELNGEAFPGVHLILARSLADHEECHDEARAILSDVGADAFARLPLGTFWSAMLVVSAETAALVELPDVAATIRDLLLPFADQIAFPGLWVAAPIAYGIGVAARACGDARANAWLEQSATIAAKLQAPVLEARAREWIVEPSEPDAAVQVARAT